MTTREGVPLVLLHGFAGSGADWEPVCRALAGRVVIAPDLPGHAVDAVSGHRGAGGPTASTGAPNSVVTWPDHLSGAGLVTSSLADAADALVEQLPARFDLAGYSLGGRLALALAVRHPSRVVRLLIASASPGLQDPTERAVRCDADEAWARVLRTEGLAAFFEQWNAQPLFASRAGKTPTDWRERRLERDAEGLARAIVGFGPGRQLPLQEALPALRVPTLWLAGELDAKYGAIARQSAALMPHAAWQIVRGAGHDLLVEAPEALAAPWQRPEAFFPTPLDHPAAALAGDARPHRP